MEKAAAQNSQHALLAEGVAAAVLLSRLALLDTQTGEYRCNSSLAKDLGETHCCDALPLSAEAKFSSFWNLLLDEKKPLFTTDKFLSQANEESEANTPSTFHHTNKQTGLILPLLLLPSLHLQLC